MPSGLLERIANRYQRQGYQVYGLPPRYPDLPQNWEGPLPDLCVQRENERTVYFGAMPQPCRALRTGKRLNGSPRTQRGSAQEEALLQTLRRRVRAAIQNPGVQVCLICSSRECPFQPGATTCIFSRKILDCAAIRRLQPASRPSAGTARPSRFLGLTPTQWRAFGLTLLVVLLIGLFIQMMVTLDFPS